jgi:Ca-activated chloride channel family protein
MTFETPLLLAAAPILGGLFLAGAGLARRRRLRAASAWSAALGAVARKRARWTPAVLAVGGALAAVAFAGPRGGPRSVVSESRALDLVIAVDVSRSMLAEDVAPGRLQRAVREARRLVEDLQGDRMGLIAFAGKSYILSPLTVDGGAVEMYLDALDPDIASEGGTNLSAVLRQGSELLTATRDGADRVLVVFTDGELHDSLDDAAAAARAVARQGITLILVAEGGTEPARIPIRDENGALLEYKLDENGEVVRTRRSDDALRAIAEAAKGSVVASELPDQAGAVRELVATLRRSASRESRTADLEPLAWVPMLVAAVLLLLDTWRQRSGALVGLLLVLGATSASAQRPSPGERKLASGDHSAAASAFLKEASRAASDTALYDAGTAALAANDLEAARSALSLAAKSVDPGLRYRALYNLGVVSLMSARADSAKRDAWTAEAIEQLREALLLAPGSERAKWNLELAERMRPPPSGGGGGGQSGGPSKPQPQQASPSPAPGGLNKSQAEQILTSMEREELGTQVARQRKIRASPPPGKDW